MYFQPFQFDCHLSLVFEFSCAFEVVEVFAQQVQFLGLCAADDYSALWLARAVLDPGRQIAIGDGVPLLALDGYRRCMQFVSACLAACEHERS